MTEIPSWLTDAICCPGCGGDLKLGTANFVKRNRTIDTSLDCLACHKGYPVVGATPILLVARAKKLVPAKT